MGAFRDADTGNIRKRQAWDTDWKQHNEILLLTCGALGRLLQMLVGSIYKAAPKWGTNELNFGSSPKMNPQSQTLGLFLSGLSVAGLYYILPYISGKLL